MGKHRHYKREQIARSGVGVGCWATSKENSGTQQKLLEENRARGAMGV